MGLLSWLGAALGAFLLGRVLRREQHRWWIELPLAAFVSVVAGLAATAMDFGGWGVLDARATGFAFLCAAAAIALARVAMYGVARPVQ